jgi:hypothetical protein
MARRMAMSPAILANVTRAELLDKPRIVVCGDLTKSMKSATIPVVVVITTVELTSRQPKDIMVSLMVSLRDMLALPKAVNRSRLDRLEAV